MLKIGHQFKLFKHSEIAFMYDLESFLRYFNQQTKDENGVNSNATELYSKDEIEQILIGFYKQYKDQIQEFQMVDLLDISIKASNLFFLKYYYNELAQGCWDFDIQRLVNNRAELLDSALGTGNIKVLEYVYNELGVNKNLNSKSNLINICKYSVNQSVSFNFFISKFNLSSLDICEIFQKINPFKLDSQVVVKLFSGNNLTIQKLVEVISLYFDEEFTLKNSNIIKIINNVLGILRLIYIKFDSSSSGVCKGSSHDINYGQVLKKMKCGSTEIKGSLTSNNNQQILKVKNSTIGLLLHANLFTQDLEKVPCYSELERDRKLLKFFIFQFLNHYKIKRMMKDRYLIKMGLEYITKYKKFQLLEFIIPKPSKNCTNSGSNPDESSSDKIDTNSYGYKYGLRFSCNFQLFKYIYENYRQYFSWDDNTVGCIVAENGDVELMKFIHENNLNSSLINSNSVVEYAIRSPNVQMMEYLLTNNYPKSSFNLVKFGNPDTLVYIIEKTSIPLNLNTSIEDFEKRIAQLIKNRLESNIDQPSRYKSKGIPHKSSVDIIIQMNMVLEKPYFLY